MAILAVATCLRLYQLGAESFSYDEGIMIEATSSGWDEVWANVTRGRPPLIVITGFIWVNLFGESELAVRLLPALMGILSVGLLFGTGHILFNAKIGLLSAAVMAIATFHIFHSQDYRYYSLLTMMALLSFLFYSLFLKDDQETDKQRWTIWVGYVLCSGLVYYTHYQGVFLLVAQGLFFLTRWLVSSPSLRWRWFSSQLTIALLLLPSLLKIVGDFTAGSDSGEFKGSIGAMGNLGPLSDPELWLPFHTLFVKYFFISIGNLFYWPSLLVALTLLIGGFLYGWLNRRRVSAKELESGDTATMLKNKPSAMNRWFETQTASLSNEGLAYPVSEPPTTANPTSETPVLNSKASLVLVLLWVIVPVFLPFLLSKIFGPMYLPRYTIGALPAMSISVALVMSQLHRWVPLWASYGALLIMVLPGLMMYYETDFKDEWRSAATYVASQLSDRDRLLFASVNNETGDRIQSLFLRYLEPSVHSGFKDGIQDGKQATVQPDLAIIGMERLDDWRSPKCTVSAGLTPSEQIQPQFVSCMADGNTLWLISRPAKPGPQGAVEEMLLSSVPIEWVLVDEERFSGVMVRRYKR